MTRERWHQGVSWVGWACVGVLVLVGCSGSSGSSGPQPPSDASASTCGNGVLDPGEACDPGIADPNPGSCPTMCTARGQCQVARFEGSAADCTLQCIVEDITTCADGDGCCPAACSAADDPDCSKTCGNGVVEAGETCDGNCPTSCDDGLACTEDRMNGSTSNCTATCSHKPIVDCVGGDGCCPPGCTSDIDGDCSATCGNAHIEAGETCDGNCPTDCNDGNACTVDTLTGSAATCSAACSYEPITACQSGDGCCPPGCTAAADNDCSATCGNGVVEPGETCDGNCPVDCNDGNGCTLDTLTGSAATCSASCSHQPIAACQSGDGCCPAGCDATTDSDCSASCGNGVVEAPETCDGNCPVDCNDGNTCTLDTLTGSAATCSASCSHQPITACQSGDGCCPAGCNAASDTDCSATCGNGVVEPGETCDGNCPVDCNDGNACTVDTLTGSAATCSASCSHQPITACQSGDGCCPAGCDATTDSDCSATCGNGVVEPGETCDGNCPADCNDGNACTVDTLTGSAATCSASCSHQPISACQGGDGCCPAGCNATTDSDCSASCGNGVVEPGETCDGDCPADCNDGNACTVDTLTGSAATCSASCSHQPISACQGGDGCCPAGCNATTDSDCSATCGNGVVEPGETCDGDCPADCDDANACTVDTLTGSAATCSASCSHQAIASCQDGDGCCPAGCNATTDSDCSATCGNGVVEPGETCDTGIASGPGACPQSCDDGDACTFDQLTGSQCSAQCSHTPITQATNGDGCCPPGATNATDSDCLPTCGNGVVDAGEDCDVAIAAGQPGACPTSCDDGDACTTDTLAGSGCSKHCVHDPVTAFVDGDGCCPPGAGASVDADCPAMSLIGTPQKVCTGPMQTPTLAAGHNATNDARFAVGCVPDASQNEIGEVHILDGQGYGLATHYTLTTDGYYYTDLALSFHDGRFQLIYQYNCDDNGSFNVGWGWGCIDFREYDPSGSEVTPSLVFGNTGHNGHPVLDWSGTVFGVAWVSYDKLYFRRIDANRQLIGNGKGDNTLVGADPLHSDARDGARTQIAWDMENGGFGILSIIGQWMYFARVDVTGTLKTPLKQVVAAGSNTAAGRFTMLYGNGAYAVAYPKGWKKTRFMRVSLTGDVLCSTTVQSDTSYPWPAMVAVGGKYLVFTNGPNGVVRVTVYDDACQEDTAATGTIDLGAQIVIAPTPAYDAATGTLGLAYRDGLDNIYFSLLSPP